MGMPDEGGGGDMAMCNPGLLRPSARGAHDAVRLPEQNAIAVFGGDTAPFDPTGMQPAVYLDELWQSDLACEAWTHPMPAGAPSARGLYAAAYDAKRARMLMMGGRTHAAAYVLHNDVWALDAATGAWSQLAPTGTPPTARQSHRAVYDAAKDRLLVFGGNAGTLFGDQPLADTWELSFAGSADGAWRQIMGAGPSARQDVASVIEPQSQRWIIYGGAASFIAYSPETWGFDLAGDTWKQLDDGGTTPGNRFWGELIDAGGGKLILFGGHDDGAIGLRNDTWTLGISSDGTTATWTNLIFGDGDLTPDGADRMSPERRDKHSLVATGDGRAWLFGGVTDCGPIDDVWLLDIQAGTWSNPWKPQVGETCARRAAPTQMCPSDCGNPL
jgi:hypothetical protein